MMQYVKVTHAFSPGRIVATPALLEEVAQDEWEGALRRHLACDWGDVSEGDRRANDQALKTGERLLSAYCTQNDLRFWIITEADRSATTLLFPYEY